MSRLVSTAFSLILVAVSLLAAAPERASAAPPQTAYARAREAYAAMQAHYYLPDNGLYRELVPPRPGGPALRLLLALQPGARRHARHRRAAGRRPGDPDPRGPAPPELLRQLLGPDLTPARRRFLPAARRWRRQVL